MSMATLLNRSTRPFFNFRLLDQINRAEFEDVFHADTILHDGRYVFMVRGCLKNATEDFPQCIDLYEMDGQYVGNHIKRYRVPCECA